MIFLYALGVIPAIAAFYFARNQFAASQRRLPMPPAISAHFLPHILGWGMLAFVLWFFVVSFWAQLADPDRLVWLLAAPVAFAAGELFGLFMWLQEVHGFSCPRPLVKEYR